jgi:PTH1 family peptidyl-tRNA hydrolase
MLLDVVDISVVSKIQPRPYTGLFESRSAGSFDIRLIRQCPAGPDNPKKFTLFAAAGICIYPVCSYDVVTCCHTLTISWFNIFCNITPVRYHSPMALFQRRPQTSNPLSYTTIGLNRNLLIVGLGNPGREYDGTRHNIGFACAEAFVGKNSEMGQWVDKKDLKCLMSTGQMGDTRVMVIKPTTYMNLSGEAVQAVSHFYKIHPDQIVVVHDELDIDFGQIRMRRGGSAAGHNGIKSVTQHMGEDYGRVRIGIGPKAPEQIDSADFVLQKFNSQEQGRMPELTREVNAVLSELVYGAQITAETRSFLI